MQRGGGNGTVPALAIHLIVAFAALGATVTGYGFVVLSAPLLALLLPPHLVVPLALALGWLLGSALLLRPTVRHAVDVRLAARLALTGILGVPVGTWLLAAMQPDVLRLALGLVSAGAAAIALTGVTLPVRRPGAAYVTGFVSGVLSGSVGLSGPPLALYLTSSDAPKATFRATAMAVVWVLSVLTLAQLALLRQLSPDIWRDILTHVPALAAGAVLGWRLFPTLSLRRFRQAALGLAAAAGVITAVVGALH
jgi:uncharacterized membrane protein YfcA